MMAGADRIKAEAGKACLTGWRRARLVAPLLASVVAATLVAGCSSSAKNDTFDLSSIRVTPQQSRARHVQILVPEPTALKALDSEQVVVRLGQSEIQYLAGAQWGDKLPRMVQARLVQAFENSGRFAGVGKPGQGLAIDSQIVTDIRAFEVDATAGKARVEISVKLINDRNGTVKAQKTFTAETGAGSGNPAYVRALDVAFGKVTADMLDWVLKSL